MDVKHSLKLRSQADSLRQFGSGCSVSHGKPSLAGIDKNPFRRSAMKVKQPITKKLNVPADKVWKAIRDIGSLDLWFPIIESCKVEGTGVGVLRKMSLVGGGEIQDTIEEIDEVNWRLVYLRTISPFPVTYYRGTVEVFEAYDNLGVVIWTIDFESESDQTSNGGPCPRGDQRWSERHGEGSFGNSTQRTSWGMKNS
jgi:hypothetical protein